MKRLLILGCFLLAQLGYGQVLLEADGPGNTYSLITSVLAPGYNPIEAPDCSHTSFGEHIDEIFDSELNTSVFRFYIHTTPDDDRCINFDRQRNEIKTYDKSPDYLLGVENEKVIYKWKFKLEAGFQSSSNFTHIHQLKSVGGPYSSHPMYTLTTRKGNPDQLELRYAETDASSVMAQADLAPFIDIWLEVTETITYGISGTYEIEIKTVNNGTVLFQYSNPSIINWRPDATFVRPKWGIYRSLNNAQDLRDETLYFANFSIEEIVYDCPQFQANIGDSCDDGNPNTINDVYNSNCVCAGQIIYDCPQFQANIGDSCDDGNPNTVNDVYNSNCVCAGQIVYDCPQFQANIGDSCDDGNPNTVNDVYNSNCVCAGQIIYDCPQFQANIGDSCDDGNPNTVNDVYNSNCVCAGQIVYDCPQFQANIGDSCDDGNPNTVNDVYNSNCVCAGQIVYDCPQFQANIGDSCDDGNPNTVNDVYNSNCVCAGVIVYDCPQFQVNIGDSCNDGDPNTANDVFNSNCVCAGQIVYDCPQFQANIGDSCDDGDPNTQFDYLDANCNCQGIVLYDCPQFQANIGDSCDDGDPNTQFDYLDANCICQGVIIYGCSQFQANIGDSCDDGDSCTIGETYDSNCNCSGGISQDTDNDNVCDELDLCPNGDDGLDTNNNNIPDACEPCLPELIITTIAGNGIYGAMIIMSNATLQVNQNIEFKGEDYIELQSGFEVEQGAELLIKIEPCDSN